MNVLILFQYILGVLRFTEFLIQFDFRIDCKRFISTDGYVIARNAKINRSLVLPW